jgi:hypothetical protein
MDFYQANQIIVLIWLLAGLLISWLYRHSLYQQAQDGARLTPLDPDFLYWVFVVIMVLGWPFLLRITREER